MIPSSSMPRDLTTPVTRNLDLGHGSFLIEFDAPDLIDGMQPAQFFMISVPGSDALLRRPFSVCGLPGTFEDASPTAAQVLYKIVGRGTAHLAALRAGATLSVLGPLGRGFELPEGDGVTPVLVAGGIGSAPFPALVAHMLAAGHEPVMLYGARSSSDLPLLDWFRERCAEVVVTTDDGSAGERALVTAPLERLIDRLGTNSVRIYACGPGPMLRAVAGIALRRGVRCDLSLEARMACGFGVCLGCVVPTHGAGPDGDDGFERVCVEGPVMRAERLAW
jgi:dihydroorotate dehydrogenase electron transfer subunit